MFEKHRSQVIDMFNERHRAKRLDMGYREPSCDSTSLLRIHDSHMWHIKSKLITNTQKISLHKDRLIMTSVKVIQYSRK